MLNDISMMGRLVANPELRHTKGESPLSVCTFRIACDRDFGKKEEKKTDFMSCTAWRSTAEFVSQHFKKGRMIVVHGRIQDREWTDKDNNKRTDKEIIVENAYFGDSKRLDSASSSTAPDSGGYPSGNGEPVDF